MQITLDNVTKDPNYYFRSVLDGDENLIIASDKGNLVITKEQDWNQLNETLRLLTDKKSLRSLLEGINSRQIGTSVKSYSFEDVFSGL